MQTDQEKLKEIKLAQSDFVEAISDIKTELLKLKTNQNKQQKKKTNT